MLTISGVPITQYVKNYVSAILYLATTISIILGVLTPLSKRTSVLLRIRCMRCTHVETFTNEISHISVKQQPTMDEYDLWRWLYDYFTAHQHKWQYRMVHFLRIPCSIIKKICSEVHIYLTGSGIRFRWRAYLVQTGDDGGGWTSALSNTFLPLYIFYLSSPFKIYEIKVACFFIDRIPYMRIAYISQIEA